MPIFHYQKPKPVFNGAYKKSDLAMPSGAVFDAPLASNDSSAETGQTLNVSGNVTYSTVDGIPCAYFDGSSYILTSDAQLPAGNSARTVSLWTKKGSASSDITLLSYGTVSTNQRFAVGFSGDHLEVWGKDNTVSYDYTFDTAKWYHIAVTLDGATEKLYVNGDLVTETTHADLNTVLNELCIGASAGNRIENYVGSIATVRVYNEVLTDAEILTLSNEFIPAKGLVPVFNAPLISSEVTTGQTLTATGNVTYSEDGAVFDGSSYLTTDSGMTTLNKGTFQCRFKRTVTTSSDVQAIFCMGTNTSGGQAVAFIWNDTGKLVFTNSGNDLNTTITVEDGREYLLTCVFDGSKATVYVDKEQVASGSLSISPNNSTLRIGAWNRSDTSYFNGTISDFKVFPKALTAEELVGKTSTGFDNMGFAVPYDMASDARCDKSMIPKDGLVFYARLDRDSAAAETGQALEESGNITYSSGGAVFDGSSYITTDSGSTNLQEGTIHCKFRSSGIGGAQTIFCLGPYYGYSQVVAYLSGSRLILTNDTYDLGSSLYVAQDRDYILTMTYDGTTAAAYVNGEQVANGTLQTQPRESTLRIGAWLHSTTRCFVGTISTVCVWDRILTSDEIQRLAKGLR